MASPGDNINPVDHILSRMSDPPAAEDLPAQMNCPSGHRASRYVIKTPPEGIGIGVMTEAEAEQHHQRDIPVWVCPACVVAYRYQECTLIPGEEGHA